MASFAEISMMRGGMPCSPDAERSILGAILLNSNHYFEGADEGLNTYDFSLESHRVLWSAFCEMIENGRSIDLVTVIEHLTVKQIENVGGRAYIASLTEGLPRRISIADYVQIVKEKAKRREVINAANRMLAAAMDETIDTQEIIATMQMSGLEIAAESSADALKHISRIVPEAAARVRLGAESDSQTQALGLTTGVQDLDAITKGLYPNEFTIIGGETGGGKTALILQMAIENARAGVPVVIFSSEMRNIQLVSRSFSYVSDKITANMIRDPRGLSFYDLEELGESEKKVCTLPIFIDDTSGLTWDQLRARAKMAIRKHKARLTIIDYLQLIQVPNIRNPTEKMEHVAFGCRDLAKTEKDHHVVAISQYGYDDNPGNKKRKRKHKGSSSIEQACQNAFDIEFDPEDDEAVNIHITKQREGAKASVKCRYNRLHLRYEKKEATHRDVG
jgi:replicative DNA helicase